MRIRGSNANRLRGGRRRRRCPAALIIGGLCALLFLPPIAGAEGFLQTLLKITGISRTPSQQKGLDSELQGEIWISRVDQNRKSRIGSGAGYRSPLFTPKDDFIIALNGNSIVRFPVTGGSEQTLHTFEAPPGAPAVMKLVGFNTDALDQVLMIFEQADGLPLVKLFSLETRKLTDLRYEANNPDERRMVDHLVGWERVYTDTPDHGPIRLYVDITVERGRFGFMRKYSDVYIERRRGSRDFSQCDRVSCGQPSLSHDGRQVVYIRALK